MSSVDKIKWAMSLRDPQYEALKRQEKALLKNV